MRKVFCIRRMSAAVCLLAGVVSVPTYLGIRPVPGTLLPADTVFSKFRITDRNLSPLSVTYRNDFNFHDYVPLYEIPEFLRDAFVFSEDRRFMRHSGVDWRARASAFYQNIAGLRVKRGASTITEQVVRIISPRPRSLWSRWIEGFEAARLEGRFSKAELLEFYLNEVPFSRNRRGVVQAARTYFARDLSTLNNKEMLFLAVIVRAPGRLDPGRTPGAAEAMAEGLARRMKGAGLISLQEYEDIKSFRLKFKESSVPPDTSHFVSFLGAQNPELYAGMSGRLVTTIDPALQRRFTGILRSRLADLSPLNIRDGAVLVLDHRRDEILAWVNSNDFTSDRPGSMIDAVTTARQPGSALKPFVYAMALERGWNAATLIDDSPLAQAVGTGMHSYRNYSRVYYGGVRLRDALGNSLNIPAVRTIGFLGVSDFHGLLHRLGFASLNRPPLYYGEGLALGNGEVSLLELVNAYAVLARGGVKRESRYLLNSGSRQGKEERIFSPETASVISDILSDPFARRLEFGSSGLLNFPVQTAVKTGTSTDYRDVWAAGYNDKFTVGVWMGNLHRDSTSGVTGANGPALVLRSVFRELNKFSESRGLFKSSGLVRKRICSLSGKLAGSNCPVKDEWFAASGTPGSECSSDHTGHAESGEPDESGEIKIAFPTPGLNVAADPRIPPELQSVSFRLNRYPKGYKVKWILNGVESTGKDSPAEAYSWKLEKGRFSVKALLVPEGKGPSIETAKVNFVVK